MQEPYAELWMGTHPSGPSSLYADRGKSLQQWLNENPAAMGETMVRKGVKDLPFLFKACTLSLRAGVLARFRSLVASSLHASRYSRCAPRFRSRHTPTSN
jgi:mannose-6-phosphate isomerase